MKDQKLVLLVDDDPDDLFLIEHTFRKAGLNLAFIKLRSGLEAVDYLAGRGNFSNRADHPLPCLIVIDSKMPGVNGFDFLAWKGGTPFQSIPVIMISGSLREEDRKLALTSGAVKYIVKPVQKTDLRDIAKMLG